MLNISRVCIPITFDCNFKCKYCFREIPHPLELPNITDEFKEYLFSRKKENCEAVAVTGGEPLLYFDLVKEIFSYVRPEMHKKIITNGSLLTSEIVKYINDNDIEIMLSYDGPNTKYLRGINVLDDPKILELVKKIKNLTLSITVAKGSENIYEDYLDMINRLKRNDFYLIYIPCYFNGHNQNILNGFDYNLFKKSLLKYYNNMRLNFDSMYLHYSYDKRFRAINILLDGTAVDMTSLSKVGTIHNNIEEIIKNIEDLPSNNFCKSYVNCPIRDVCGRQEQTCSEHIAKVELCINEVWNILQYDVKRRLV